MLRQGETLILSDNKKYTVATTTTLENKFYVYLIDQDDYTNIMFCEYINEELLEITNQELIEKLMITFRNNLNYVID